MMTEKTDPHTIICHFIAQVKSDFERELVQKLIYKKSARNRVKLIPFDENWVIKEDFAPCKNALIILAQIKLSLLYHAKSFKSHESKKILMYIHTLYNDIMMCMLMRGCKYVPCRMLLADECIDKDVALGMSTSIINNMLA
jgi:hypothetical protein